MRAVRNFAQNHEGAIPKEGKKRPAAEQHLARQLRALRTSASTTRQEHILLRSLNIEETKLVGSVEKNTKTVRARERFQFNKKSRRAGEEDGKRIWLLAIHSNDGTA